MTASSASKDDPTIGRKTPVWLWATGGFGILWNVYGVYQFVGTVPQTKDRLVASGMGSGMTEAQAALYLSLPAWVSVVFAVGVFGGLFGSVALMLRKTVAVPVLAVSLAGYVLLLSGDVHYGVFESIPSQLSVLALVVLIAALLLLAARSARNRGVLG